MTASPDDARATPEPLRLLVIDPSSRAAGAPWPATWSCETVDGFEAARARVAAVVVDALLWLDAPADLPGDPTELVEWPFADTAVIVGLRPEAGGHGVCDAHATHWMRLGAEDVIDVQDPPGEHWGATVRRAVERKRLEARSRREYATDPMTGLVNRQQLVEHLSHLLAVRAREPGPLGVVVLHVGGLATSGTGGDGAEVQRLVRRKVAVRLRAGVRSSDVVAALNADTYAVMLSSIDAAGDTRAVASKLAMALRHPLSVSGRSVGVSVEVGCAVAPEDGAEPEALLRSALSRASAPGYQPGVAANDP